MDESRPLSPTVARWMESMARATGAKAAQVTAQDLQRLVDRDFVASERDVVWATLNQLGPGKTDAGTLRIRAAVLRVADGNVAAMPAALRLAEDYRDVLRAAEYPTSDNQANWRQYEAWFHRIQDRGAAT